MNADQNMAELRDLITAKVKEYVMSGGKMKVLSVKAGISPNTVSRLAYGETSRPHLRTVVYVLFALGYGLQAVPAEMLTTSLKLPRVAAPSGPRGLRVV